MTDLTGAVWRKSTRSGDNGGACVEVADNLAGIIAVRDSKDATGPVLTFTAQAWADFIATAGREERVS
ncbi:DUF397 domain-containing protein [Micromonospora sp. WMMD964]|uniref:DUF397 domain-containing protein n=1 Tax=Micromonospora sp. WMMD964 TaxID=3016091 RepID=UPI00249CD461|nr:DUF397 domain-containing protein [Micromonospora sp. WMMD964]WFE99830.1 DUF397 domain-containing protein [Micromonospora sp. WMMD964]